MCFSFRFFRDIKKMIIFIRHADDDGSDPIYSHDPKITRRGLKKAKDIAFQLIERYGCPDIIFCSPFRRTIQTSKSMKKLCDDYTKIYVDNNLSRYFCKREKANPQVDPGTQKYDAPIYESWNDFEDRINKHLRMLKKEDFAEREEVVWCITHALVYKHVAKVYGIKIPTYIPFMHHFCLNEHSFPVKSFEKKSHNKRTKKRRYQKYKVNTPNNSLMWRDRSRKRY